LQIRLFSAIIAKNRPLCNLFHDRKYTRQRSKGLGENEPEMMWQTTMNPATRRLIMITPADAEETVRMFETLMGDAIAARKRFIAENGYKYIAEADI
jgi:DNA gyrase subunit B